jgi:hypothetical protein
MGWKDFGWPVLGWTNFSPEITAHPVLFRPCHQHINQQCFLDFETLQFGPYFGQLVSGTGARHDQLL